MEAVMNTSGRLGSESSSSRATSEDWDVVEGGEGGGLREDWDVVSLAAEEEAAAAATPFYDATNAVHLQLMGRVAVAITEMEARFDCWDEIAREAEEALRREELALVLLRRDVNIAQTVGSATSTGVGVPLMVAGIISMPFTLGTSAILTGLGTGISIVAGLTAGGASVAETVIRQKRLTLLRGLSERLEALAPSLEEARSSLFVILLETLREFVFLHPKHIEVAGGKFTSHLPLSHFPTLSKEACPGRGWRRW